MIQPDDEPRHERHLDGCEGNGSVSCWDCGGEGMYQDPEDPMEEFTCGFCQGTGIIRCPQCEKDGL